jgi:type II secretory pathway component PulF
MLFKYTVINQSGAEQQGTIETTSEDTAISTLQRGGFVITKIEPADKKGGLLGNLTFFEHVSNKEIVILSRQIATLFHAQVSALRVFRLLGAESPNRVVQRVLLEVADDIQGGLSISKALAKHPQMFSSFYCNMVLAGEETGRLEQTFEHLAGYIDRSYAVTSKAQHALVYPAFIIATFIGVMVLMMIKVIPQLTGMIKEAEGIEIPIYTKIVMAISDMFVQYGLFLFVGFAAAIAAGWQYAKTPAGRRYFDQMKVEIPAIGSLYKKLYLARMADNLSTMLSSGIAMVQALEITAAVVENVHYEEALLRARDEIKNGASISKALSGYEQIPTIMIQMVRVGEETGELSTILDTLAKFYEREVDQQVDTVLGLIEPAMIILLAGGVGVLIASVLVPILSITMSIK